jgi:acyl carrier protein
MEQAALVHGLHQTASEFVLAAGKSADEAIGENGDNILARYDFNSIDALEYLLIVEEKFGVTFEDEDLTEEILTSAERLAEYIMKQQTATGSTT